MQQTVQVKVTNRDWRMMAYKWNHERKTIPIHVAANINTKEILALEVTDKKIHYKKMMRKLVRHILYRNNKIRNKEVVKQTKDFLKCKKKKKYGYRWMVETAAFSLIKRIFGYVSATMFQNCK